MSIYDNIKTGKYKNQMPYPCKELYPDKDDLQMAKMRYRQQTTHLNDLFKNDLLAEHGVTDHPKAEKCFALAWEHGHASGHSEVAAYFADFAELLITEVYVIEEHTHKPTAPRYCREPM